MSCQPSDLRLFTQDAANKGNDTRVHINTDRNNSDSLNRKCEATLNEQGARTQLKFLASSFACEREWKPPLSISGSQIGRHYGKYKLIEDLTAIAFCWYGWHAKLWSFFLHNTVHLEVMITQLALKAKICIFMSFCQFHQLISKLLIINAS